MAGPRPVRSCGTFFLHAIVTALVVASCLVPVIHFYTINTDVSHDALSESTVINTFAYQISVSNGDGSSIPVSYPINADKKTTPSKKTTSYAGGAGSINVAYDGTFKTTATAHIATAGETFTPGGDGVASARVTAQDQVAASCGDVRFTSAGAAAQGSGLGSLGLPTVENQRGTGIASMSSNNADHVTRNFHAIPACLDMNFGLEAIGGTEHAKFAKKDANGAYKADKGDELLKYAYRLEGYLADYSPYASVKKHTLGVRCLVLQPFDQEKAGTCSIFLNNATKEENLDDAIALGKDAAARIDDLDDETLLTEAKLKGTKRQAFNCPILCDSGDDDDYISDRRSRQYGAHVVKATSHAVKQCIRGINSAVQETLDTSDITTTDVLASVLRSETEGDRITNSVGEYVMFFWAGSGLLAFLAVWLFIFAFGNGTNGNAFAITVGKAGAQLSILICTALFIANYAGIEDWESKHPDAIFFKKGTCPGSVASSVILQDELNDTLVASMWVPFVTLFFPYTSLFLVMIVYFFFYGLLKMSDKIDYAEYYNPQKWSVRMPYALSLLNGEASDCDADDRVSFTDYSRFFNEMRSMMTGEKIVV